MKLEKINKVWPLIGGVIAMVISVVVVVLWNRNPSGSRLAHLFWLNLAVLMFHEFEEYVFPGGFKHFINTKTVLALSEPDGQEPVSDTVIAVINLGSWVIFVIAALLVNIAPWLGFGMILFNMVNILGHLIIFQKKVKGYNPGVVTTIIMIPFLIFAFKMVIDQNLLSTGEYIGAFIIGIISGVSLPVSGSILRKKGLQKKE